MAEFWILGGGNSSGKTTRLIQKAKRLIDEGKDVKVTVYDPLVEKVIEMGIPEENILRLSEIYHQKTATVYEMYRAEVRVFEKTTKGAT